MDTIAELLNRIEIYCRAAGVTEREFGYAAVQDGRLVERLRADKGSLHIIRRVDAYLNGHAAERPARKRAASVQHNVSADAVAA